MTESQDTLVDQVEDSNEVDDKAQFVSFMVGNELFAGDMSPVQEIIRLPTLVEVPLAPFSLEGLANLRGQVLPIISMRKIFGFDEKEYDETTRAIVVNLGQPLGLIVDRVTSVLEVDEHEIKEDEQLNTTISNDLLKGVIKRDDGSKLLMILDFARVIAHEFSELQNTTQASNSLTMSQQANAKQKAEAVEEEIQLVTFCVDSQEYAIDINNVKEIVQIPEDIISIPKVSSEVIGLITLRNHILPLVSMRRIFQLPDDVDIENMRIVVMTVNNLLVGVVTDSVSQVLTVPKRSIESLPALMTQNSALDEITAICQVGESKRLMAVIDAERMFKQPTMQAAQTVAQNKQSPELDSEPSEVDTMDDEDSDDQQIVVFHLGKEEFGVPIEKVQEIVRIPEQLTTVPKAPSFVEGVINLRGGVLPVVDQRKRLGLSPIERNERQRIMVFLVNGAKSGFIVDSVTEVLKVAKTSIEKAPSLSGDQARLLGQVINIEANKRMIQLVNVEGLLSDSDLSDMESLV